ncbi:universal stress protein [Rhodococcus sp. HNM0569]|uniref:universal stress protein n=1 Tax=Rhodococcus sp. HNM0569 TaxID=2716340 RepID=UPI00146D7341|nr:universal stress protein [Rhodococcus sp. HNM0569]NLU83261.1 universal stress protein [Rhodococcus sp. HNM0569]
MTSQDTLVVGFDGHDASIAALEHAAGLAARLDAAVVVVHVLDLGDTPLDPDAARWEPDTAHRVARLRARVAEIVDAHDAAWAFEATAGDVVDVLVDRADAVDATWIVLGAPRRGLLARMDRMLGEAVAARILTRSVSPVVVVPSPS